MNLLELQTRANLIVEKVNAYEAQLTEKPINETETLAEHKYADLFCLRPVLKLLLGDTVTKKVSRTLSNDVDLPVIASSAPMWNTKFNFFNTTESYQSDQHEFMNSLDIYNNNNLIMLDQKQNLITDRNTRIKQSINYAYSSNIKDALVTESQLANVFAWNTTDKRGIKNNIQTTHRQVPGIVLYYLGNGYDNSYTATVGCNESDKLNSVQYAHPVTYGSWYVNPTITSVGGESTSQLPWLPEEGGSCCRIFIPGCNYTRGKLESPQQIWQPDRNSNQGIKYQGKAIYHELVFKNRRSGCADYNLDFTSGLADIPDNDPQGLATRLALSKQKDYYFNRPWFTELDTENKLNSSKLADELLKPEEYTKTTYTINDQLITPVLSLGSSYLFDQDTGIISCDTSLSGNSGFYIRSPQINDGSLHNPTTQFTFMVDMNDFTTSISYIGNMYTGNRSMSIKLALIDPTKKNPRIYIEDTDWSSGYGVDFEVDYVVFDCIAREVNGNWATTYKIFYIKDSKLISTKTTSEASYSYASIAPIGQLRVEFAVVDKSIKFHLAPIKLYDDYGNEDHMIGYNAPGEHSYINNGEMICQVVINAATGATKTTFRQNLLNSTTTTITSLATDEDFYNNYKLDWNTYAQVYNLPR